MNGRAILCCAFMATAVMGCNGAVNDGFPPESSSQTTKLDSGSSGVGVTSKSYADYYFTTEWGPTAYNQAGSPFGFEDCGPTSSLIALSALGYMNAPTPSSAESLISRVRDIERGYPTSYSSPTYTPMLVAGIRRMGGRAERAAASLAGIDNALQDGSFVLLAGNPKRAWGLLAASRGNYLVTYEDPNTVFDHWVAILGKRGDGKYLVADPLSRIGTTFRASEEVQSYMDDSLLGAAAVEIW